MLSPLPRRCGWAYHFAHSPSRVSLPRKGCRVGLRIVLFEACSAFTRVTACTLALSPIRDTHSEGFSYFVTSIAAPVASGWSGCRVGLAPTGKRRLVTAHTHRGHRPQFTTLSRRSDLWCANGFGHARRTLWGDARPPLLCQGGDFRRRADGRRDRAREPLRSFHAGARARKIELFHGYTYSAHPLRGDFREDGTGDSTYSSAGQDSRGLAAFSSIPSISALSSGSH